MSYAKMTYELRVIQSRGYLFLVGLNSTLRVDLNYHSTDN